MARLWSCGAELQSATAGIEWDTNTGTAPTISTTTVRSGTASLRFNPSAATSYITHQFIANGIRNQYARVYIRFASFPTADCPILGWFDGSSTFPTIKFIAATSKLQAQDGTPANIGSASATLSLNTWYRLEMQYNDTTGDTVNAYLDGTIFCTAGVGGDIGGLGQIRIGIQTATTADMFVDDIAINDDTGSFQNGLPGSGKIVHLLPNAAGDNNLFATAVGGTAGAANNYTRVSEVTPDDATSYNNTTATGTTTIDDFNVTDTATAGIGASDTITLVQVGQRAGSSATTTASIVTRIKGQASGTTTESASIAVNTVAFNTHASAAPKTYKITAYTNPQTSTAWTASTLDTMQIGYRGNVSQTTQRRVTTLWALVDYVPVTAVNASAGDAADTHQAGDPTPQIAVPDVTAPALAHNTFDATVTITTTDGTAPALAHAAGDPAMGITVPDVTAPALAHAASDAVFGLGFGDVTAPANAHTTQSPTLTLTTADGTAPALAHATGTPAPKLDVNDGTAPALTHQTFDATVSTAVIVNVNAGDAATAHAAGDPAAKFDVPDVTAPAAAHATGASAPGLAVPGGAAANTHQAFDATVSTVTNVNASAGDAATAHQASGVTATQTTLAEGTFATHSAFDCTVTTSLVPPAFIDVGGSASWTGSVEGGVTMSSVGGTSVPGTTTDGGSASSSGLESGTTTGSLVG